MSNSKCLCKVFGLQLKISFFRATFVFLLLTEEKEFISEFFLNLNKEFLFDEAATN